MKQRYILLLSLLLMMMGLPRLSAQNLQLHYDLGSRLYAKEMPRRPQLTTTIEHFRPDAWGSTFYFVDLNYQDQGIQSAYWEIARDLKLWSAPLALRLEYNGGLSNSFSYDDAYLVGLSYAYNAPDYSWGWGIAPLYKHLAGRSRPHSWQLTGTWYLYLMDRALTFTGFADLWQDRFAGLGDGLVFISEPQIWCNFNRLRGFSSDFGLSIGAEVELSYSFLRRDGLYAIPTVGLKWTFF